MPPGARDPQAAKENRHVRTPEAVPRRDPRQRRHSVDSIHQYDRQGNLLSTFPIGLEAVRIRVGKETPAVQFYCGPAVPNSSGAPATIDFLGSAEVSAGTAILFAADLPTGRFGYFLAGQTSGFAMPVGSVGYVCLAGNIGRFNDACQIVTGPRGSLLLDLAAIPVNPTQAVVPGETWNFQCWFRDAGSTNNFTNGVAVTFY
ncbi:MAG: hypothetical protein GY711_12275 [bacterium]|nr:hypothetical protein [bacterium]